MSSTIPIVVGVHMRTIYAHTESAVSLAEREHVVGVVERPGCLAQYCVDGEHPPAVCLAQLRRALPSSLLPALAVPGYHRPSDHDAWQWAPPEERRSRRRGRLTHAGRERKKFR